MDGTFIDDRTWHALGHLNLVALATTGKNYSVRRNTSLKFILLNWCLTMLQCVASSPKVEWTKTCLVYTISLCSAKGEICSIRWQTSRACVSKLIQSVKIAKFYCKYRWERERSDRSRLGEMSTSPRCDTIAASFQNTLDDVNSRRGLI